MTTVGDAVKAAIDTNWNVGTGGVEPVLYNSEDVGQGWPPDNDWVMILGWEYDRKRKRRNDTYISETYTIDMRVHSKNDAGGEERLDELVTEIYRIVTPTNVTGFHTVDIIYETRRASDKRTNRFIADLTVELVVKSASASATPGSVATSEIDVDELTVNTSIAGAATIDMENTIKSSADNKGIYTGAGDDFRIYHSGTATFFDNNTGNLNIDSTGLVYLRSNGSTVGFHVDVSQDCRCYGDLTISGATPSITGTNIADLLMFGSANAAWVPCVLEGWNPTANGVVSNIGEIENVDNTVIYITYLCPLPPLKGALKLYIAATKIHVNNANATNYITTTNLEGLSTAYGKTAIDIDATNKNSAGAKTDTFASAYDCSSYSAIQVRLQTVTADALALSINNIEVQCYYAA